MLACSPQFSRPMLTTCFMPPRIFVPHTVPRICCCTLSSIHHGLLFVCKVFVLRHLTCRKRGCCFPVAAFVRAVFVLSDVTQTQALHAFHLLSRTAATAVLPGAHPHDGRETRSWSHPVSAVPCHNQSTATSSPDTCCHHERRECEQAWERRQCRDSAGRQLTHFSFNFIASPRS